MFFRNIVVCLCLAKCNIIRGIVLHLCCCNNPTYNKERPASKLPARQRTLSPGKSRAKQFTGAFDSETLLAQFCVYFAFLKPFSPNRPKAARGTRSKSSSFLCFRTSLHISPRLGGVKFSGRLNFSWSTNLPYSSQLID